MAPSIDIARDAGSSVLDHPLSRLKHGTIISRKPRAPTPGGLSDLTTYREAELEVPWSGRADPSASGDGGGSEPSRVLVPYNGTTTSRKALDVAVWLSQGSSTVFVLYVRPFDVGKGGPRFCFETTAEARACAESAVTYLRGRGVAASAMVLDARRERIAHAIVAQAEGLGADCIILGTAAHRTLVSALLGSTSLAVARRSRRRVIMVKDAGHPSRRRLSWRSARTGSGEAKRLRRR